MRFGQILQEEGTCITRARIQFFRVPAFLLMVVFPISTLSAQNTLQARTAMEILDATGLKGGLIVHLGLLKIEKLVNILNVRCPP